MFSDSLTNQALTNSPTLHSECAAVGQRQCAPQHEVSNSLRRAAAVEQADAERELDEGVDYFSAQGALDRWRLLNKAEGRIE